MLSFMKSPMIVANGNCPLSELMCKLFTREKALWLQPKF
jgi:hypothetical protein